MLRVETITDAPKRISADEVRARIAADEDWEPLVPPAVRRWVRRLDAARRLGTAPRRARRPR